MTLNKTRELLTIQISMASDYNGNSANLFLLKSFVSNGQAAVNQLIREMNLETAFGLKPGEKIII